MSYPPTAILDISIRKIPRIFWGSFYLIRNPFIYSYLPINRLESHFYNDKIWQVVHSKQLTKDGGGYPCGRIRTSNPEARSYACHPTDADADDSPSALHRLQCSRR